MEIPEGYVNIRYVFSLDGVEDEMSFAIGGLVPIGDDATEVAFNADAAFAGAGLGGSSSMHVGWNYLGTRVIKTLLGTPSSGEYVLNVAGSASGSTVPSNCALLVRKGTALGGRKYRGRCFVPPWALAETSVDQAGNIAPALVASLQTNFTDLLTELLTFEISPRLFHTSPSDTPTTITTLTVQSLLATQRRRMR